MPTPHDVQEPYLTVEFQCREEGTFKASRTWAIRSVEAVRQEADGFGPLVERGGALSSANNLKSSERGYYDIITRSNRAEQ